MTWRSLDRMYAMNLFRILIVSKNNQSEEMRRSGELQDISKASNSGEQFIALVHAEDSSRVFLFLFLFDSVVALTEVTDWGALSSS